VSAYKLQKKRWIASLTLMVALLLTPLGVRGYSDRKVKVDVKPQYPLMAKKMSVSGTVKLELTVAPNGTVKSIKVLGGHPLLIEAAESAAKQRKYEAGPEETTETVAFNFTLE
jgi:TonB family protein